MTNEMLVEIKGLSKQFGSKTVLNEIDLELPVGHIVGLIGPNSAGKSTLLRHLIGLYLPTRGTCRTLGCDAKDLSHNELQQIGYVHQEPEFLNWMRGDHFLEYVRVYYPNWNEDLEKSLIKRLEIDLKKKIQSMSTGEKQKLAILSGICFEPKLMLLDEPAAALDPLARAELMRHLMELIQNSDRTIIISSHILSDIEKIVDHVLVLKNGRFLRNCSLDTLKEDYCKLSVTALEGQSFPERFPFSKESVLETHVSGRSAILTLRGVSETRAKELLRNFRVEVECKPVPLDEIYVFEMREAK